MGCQTIHCFRCCYLRCYWLHCPVYRLCPGSVQRRGFRQVSSHAECCERQRLARRLAMPMRIVPAQLFLWVRAAEYRPHCGVAKQCQTARNRQSQMDQKIQPRQRSTQKERVPIRSHQTTAPCRHVVPAKIMPPKGNHRPKWPGRNSSHF